MEVKFVDLKKNYQELKPELDAAMQKVMEDGDFILGKPIYEFQKNFAAYIGERYCCSCDNGTNAIELALRTLNIGLGNNVVTVANSFVATALGISAVGAEIKLVDCTYDTQLIDVLKIEDAITPNTKAIIPVHLFGQQANMEIISYIASKHKLHIVEDSCQYHTPKKRDWHSAMSCYSFYPGKNLGCAGDSGAVLCSDISYFNNLSMLRNVGAEKKYHHQQIGMNARMDSLQGAILNVKLKYLDEWNERRRKFASMYMEQLSGLDNIILPTVAKGNTHTWHLFAVKILRKRDELQQVLKDKKIETGIHYPIPIHKQQCYPELNKLSFPITERLAKENLSLPMHPHLTQDEVSYVCETIRNFYK